MICSCNLCRLTTGPVQEAPTRAAVPARHITYGGRTTLGIDQVDDEFVKSADSTQMGYDRLGSGPLVVVVSGNFIERPDARGRGWRTGWLGRVSRFDR
jgi:hypothetical protein